MEQKMSNNPRIIITGGGTGGHVYPGIVIAEELQRLAPGAEILFVGTCRGLEATVIPQLGFEIEYVDVSYFVRSLSWKNFAAAYKALRALTAAKKIIRQFDPDVVVGTGGYVSGPVVLAAVQMKIPTLIQEQNAFPGLTTRWLAGRVNKVAVSHGDAIRRISARAKTVITGHPVRRQIFEADRSEGRRKFNLAPRQQLVLVVGGSGGAERLNQVVLAAAGQIVARPDNVLLHVTGPKYHGWMVEEYGKLNLPAEQKKRYRLTDYMHDMPTALAASDLVIARSGGMIHEITGLGRPSVLIPSPNVTEDHQLHNARSMAKEGAAVVIEEHQLSADLLAKTVLNLLTNADELARMAAAAASLGRPEAGDKIAKMIFKLIKTH